MKTVLGPLCNHSHACSRSSNVGQHPSLRRLQPHQPGQAPQLSSQPVRQEQW